jgi:oligopeptide/dipeptide ABC transporter ATP-binding protein
MKSIPRIDDIRREKRLYSIEGSVPDAAKYPEGCRFHPRCPFATEECRLTDPALEQAGSGHAVRCIHWERITRQNKGLDRP